MKCLNINHKQKNQIFKIQEATIHIQWENLDEMDVLNKWNTETDSTREKTISQTSRNGVDFLLKSLQNHAKASTQVVPALVKWPRSTQKEQKQPSVVFEDNDHQPWQTAHTQR